MSPGPYDPQVLQVMFFAHKNQYRINGRSYHRDDFGRIIDALKEAKSKGYTHATGFDDFGSVDPIDDHIEALSMHMMGY